VRCLQPDQIVPTIGGRAQHDAVATEVACLSPRGT
jgi:hypothetical protein